MRTNFFISVLILNALCAGFVNAQTKQVAPVPGDPLELATGPATIADTLRSVVRFSICLNARDKITICT